MQQTADYSPIHYVYFPVIFSVLYSPVSVTIPDKRTDRLFLILILIIRRLNSRTNLEIDVFCKTHTST